MFYKRMCCLVLVLVFLTGISACSQSRLETRNIDENGRKVITFACANLTKSDEGILKVAVEQFQNENPDAVVDIKDLSKMGYDTNRYISTINTELMAGKGPDIIPITYLPALKYFKKKIFSDLSGFIKDDESFKEENLITNVVEASKYNGALYAIPVKFSFSGVIGSKDTLSEEEIVIDDKTWNTDDFIEIARKVTKDLNGDGTIDRYALPQMPMEGVVKLFINSGNFVDYENKKATFDSKEFIELLKLLKTISTNKLTHKSIKLGQEIPYRNSREVVFSGGAFEGYRGLLSFKYILGGGTRVLFKLPSFRKSDSYAFDSNMMLSIVDASKNKDLAWKFLKVLLSEDIQKQFAINAETTGFPIDKKALELQKLNVKTLDWRVKDDTEGWIPITFTKAEFDYIDDYISHINTYQYNDIRVENIVVNEIGNLFSKGFSFNEKDAGDIARNIQRKVTLYLEE
jgi:ABC-type glycerol-3-phosphate transport system substrate-binding protein